MSDTERFEDVEYVESQFDPSVVDFFYKKYPEAISFIIKVADNEAYIRFKRLVSQYRADSLKEKRRALRISLNQYRTVKAQISEKYTVEEEIQMRFNYLQDLMRGKDPDEVVKDKEKARMEMIAAIYRIDSALYLYEKDVNGLNNAEKIRRHRILRRWFIDGEKPTIEEIALEEGVSDKTVMRDIGIALEDMLGFLFILEI